MIGNKGYILHTYWALKRPMSWGNWTFQVSFGCALNRTLLPFGVQGIGFRV